MKKNNLVEILKNCPKGMELDCTMFDNVSFLRIQNGTNQIIICTPDGLRFLNSYGCYHDDYSAKCVIFPKGKTTWEGFVPPCQFKDGDVLVHTQNDRFVMSIYKSNESKIIINTYAIFWDREEGLSVGMQICCYTDSTRLATEEEKKKLFQAINDNGYRWNAGTKTLEKLIMPKFKVGDRIKLNNSRFIYTITDLLKDRYRATVDSRDLYEIEFERQDAYKLVPNKFDINTLKTFESRVLVRNTGEDIWKPAIFGCYLKDKSAPYYALGGTCWRYCIPFEGNEHLLGKTDDCSIFYKTWSND